MQTTLNHPRSKFPYVHMYYMYYIVTVMQTTLNHPRARRVGGAQPVHSWTSPTIAVAGCGCCASCAM